jgi:hypothetical protein
LKQTQSATRLTSTSGSLSLSANVNETLTRQ